ncbi:hypothetical protein acsn021_03050 [Anaerocolumna cellulosilytica]|uniref:Uncharacterized protein n=1 Tax=Anaerocolumna cellulosilytica TaxID=433286 RepID=A0A6S6QSW8_9FIRM|nr:helix-turn-helix transcriptional regulator [Anaerocolumna cellulosilytica]MBB5197294.1 transcriptional regulator with XRE-family HTH domain [Anaerocolumna cellulosilytica]BCJ92736.1 hypothetical protein acsn021_03050 [Anaerocolumna cellulosilytica]
MNNEYFGKFLQELRISRNMTREQLAKDICTPKQIYRIEKGVYEPSLYLINQLSIKFNMDLNEYFKTYFANNSIIGLEGVNAINAAIEREDVQLLKSLIDKYEKLEDFKKGENLQCICYGNALCSALIEKDYKTSLEYCYKGIQIECPNFSVDNISKFTYSNVGITLITCISQNYFAMNQFTVGMNVLFGLLEVLETYILNAPYPMFQAPQFSKKIYQGVLYNISAHLLNKGDLEDALHYVEKGLQFSIKEYNLRFLPDLTYMKFKILYKEQNYSEAKEYYNRTVYLYKITNKDDKLTELEESAGIEYPEIFTEN